MTTAQSRHNPDTLRKKNRDGVSLVLYFLRGSKRYFFISIAASLVVNLFEMLNPQIISFTVDSVLGDITPDYPKPIMELIDRAGGTEYLASHLYLIAALMLVCAAFSVVCRYIQNVFNSRGAQSFVKSMRDKLYMHIERLPYSWHKKNHTGDIIQRCTSDVDMINNFVSRQLTSVVRIVLFIIIAMIFMFRMNVQLASAAAATLPVIMLYSAIFHRGIGDKFRECDEEEGVVSSIVQENLTGVRVVRAFGRESYEKERFESRNNGLCAKWLGLNRLLTAFWGISDFISGIQIMLIVTLGTVFCVKGRMTTGEFIAFISYNSMLTWPVRMLGRMVSEMSKTGVSIERIEYIMKSEVEKKNADAVKPPLDGDIVFDHITFGYEGCPELIHDVSFSIPAGTTLGILGPTGSGKSTLMYLLDRLYDIPEDCGRITIGGVDIADIDAEWLRSNIGFVLQEPYLFSRTLGDNIGISQESPSLDDIRRASRIASLDETVDSFTLGYDTFVGERGVTLSGGQKQRAAIARMLMSNAPIMIFDDSLSAVDAETDAKIRRALSDAMGNATVIIISHRTTSIMSSDNIIVLDHGRIAESGTHEELVAKDGAYRRIYDLQMANAEDENDEEVHT